MYGVSLLLLLLAVVSWSEAKLQPVVTPVTDPVDHGEGPHWDVQKQLLYFVDIHQKKVNCYNPDTGNVTHVTIDGGEVSLVIPVANAQNEFVVSMDLNLMLLTWDSISESPQNLETITSVETDKDGNRFNDGKADPMGRIWAGTMGPEKIVGQVTPDQGSLYMIDTNSYVPVTEISPVSVSNGLAWTADNKTFYYIDSPTRQIVAYDFDMEKGEIANKRVAFDLANYNISGSPDGMTIDADDNLWIAVFDGGKVLHADPTSGTLLATVNMPAARVTSAVFGDENLETLYVTTSRFGLTDEEVAQQPLAGSTFAVTGLGVKGTLSKTVIRNV